MSINDSLQDLVSQFESQQTEIQLLKESVTQKALSLEDIGWIQIYGQKMSDEAGLDLDALHEITKDLRDMAAVNPLHKRGAQLRHSYIFGRGINFPGLEDKTKRIIKNPYNQETVFSVQAFEANNLALFTDGNFFLVRDERTNITTSVPLSQITGEVTDPDDSSRVRYFKRTWSDGVRNKELWYPVSRYKKSVVGRGKRGKGINKTISVGGVKIPVAQDKVIYHHTTQRQVGWTYGIPDSLAAKVWALSYSNYLADNATLVKALQQFAWNVTNSTKSGSNNAAVSIASGGVGGTNVMGSGNQLAGVGVPSAQVNMNNGQPLAAMVATSFGVPVIALLSSPGATGGSYGAATTLDTPTFKTMKAVQDSWIVFYDELLADMGSPGAETSFPNIAQDETYREAQAIGLAYTDGRIHQDEAREATLSVLDVPKLHQGLPKPDKFNAGGEVNDKTNPEPAQGRTGAEPGGVDQGETNHDND